jgi:hypothetical protein
MLGLAMAPLCLRTAAPTVLLAKAQLLKMRTVGVTVSKSRVIITLKLQLKKALP